MREVLGLPADPPDGALMAPLAVAGVDVAVGELAQFDERLRRQQRFTQVAPRARQLVGPGLAGVWTEPDGRLHVAAVNAVPDVETLARELGLEPELVVGESRDRAYGDLEVVQAKVLAVVTSSAEYEIVGAGIDERRNQVLAYVDGNLGVAAKDLASFGDAVAVTAGAPLTQMNYDRETPCPSPSPCGNPKWEAGMKLRVSNPLGAWCTAAFRVQYNGVAKILTAGHCGPDLNGDSQADPAPYGTQWHVGFGYPPPYPVGITELNAWPTHRDADVQFISIGVPPWGTEPDCVYFGPNNCQNLTFFGDPVQGTVSCASAGTTNVVACYLVETVNFVSDNGFWQNMAAARLLPGQPQCLWPGDSGSPFFAWSPTGILTANGVFAGSGNGECTGAPRQLAVFSKWSRIAARLGAQAPEPLAPGWLQTGSVYNPQDDRVWLFHAANGYLSYTTYDETKAELEQAWSGPWSQLVVAGNVWERNPAVVIDTLGTQGTSDDAVQVAAMARNVFSHPNEVRVYVMTRTPAGSWVWDDLGRPSSASFGLFTNVALVKNADNTSEVIAADTLGRVWSKRQTTGGSGANPKGTWPVAWNLMWEIQPMAIHGGLAAARDGQNIIELFGVTDQAGCPQCGRVVRTWKSSPSGSWTNVWVEVVPAAPVPMDWTGAGMTVQNDGNLDFYGLGHDGFVYRNWRLGVTGWWTGWATSGYPGRAGISATLGRSWNPTADCPAPNRRTYYFAAVGQVPGTESQTQSYYAALKPTGPGLGWSQWVPTVSAVALAPCS